MNNFLQKSKPNTTSLCCKKSMYLVNKTTNTDQSIFIFKWK